MGKNSKDLRIYLENLEHLSLIWYKSLNRYAYFCLKMKFDLTNFIYFCEIIRVVIGYNLTNFTIKFFLYKLFFTFESFNYLQEM